jgi:hypothetical protein
MKSRTPTLDSLLDELDLSYRAVRGLVIDWLPPGSSVKTQLLGSAQRLGIGGFDRANATSRTTALPVQLLGVRQPHPMRAAALPASHHRLRVGSV